MTDQYTADDNPHTVKSIRLEAVCTQLGTYVIGQPHERDAQQPITQPPGSNCAESFSNEVFALRAFCWCDGNVHPWALDENGEEDHPTCLPNFEHYASGITGEWYKYLGRSTYFSRDVEANEALALLIDCAASLGLCEPLVPQQRSRLGWDKATTV